MSDAKTEQFVRLLMNHEQDLFAYTFSLVPHYADAKDVMQEAAVTMWQHFGEYDATRPFFPWASRFAYFGVLTFRKRRQQSRKVLSDQAIEAIADDYQAHQPDLSPQLGALTECLEKLPAPARKLLEMHYHRRQPIKEIAERTGRNIHTLYKAFEKIRNWLLDCVNQAIAEESTA